MVRRIFGTGNSMVVSLPKDVLDALGLSEGARVPGTIGMIPGLLSLDLATERRSTEELSELLEP